MTLLLTRKKSKRSENDTLERRKFSNIESSIRLKEKMSNSKSHKLIGLIHLINANPAICFLSADVLKFATLFIVGIVSGVLLKYHGDISKRLWLKVFRKVNQFRREITILKSDNYVKCWTRRDAKMLQTTWFEGKYCDVTHVWWKYCCGKWQWNGVENCVCYSGPSQNI